MKLPEFNLPGVNLEVPEDGRARKTAAIVIAVLLVLMLVVTILIRVRIAGTGACRRSGGRASSACLCRQDPGSKKLRSPCFRKKKRD